MAKAKVKSKIKEITSPRVRNTGGTNDLDLEKSLRKIVASVARAKETDIKDNSNLRDELGLDSLNAIAILAAIEAKYGIRIDEAKAFDVVTVRDLFEMVKISLSRKQK